MPSGAFRTGMTGGAASEVEQLRQGQASDGTTPREGLGEVVTQPE